MSADDKSTRLIHHRYRAPAGFESPSVPVAKGSSVFFPNVAALRSRTWVDRSAYTYGLHGTPTTFTLEERLATLEGGTHCVLVGSGLAAITLVNMALLSRGDQLLLPDNVYGPSKNFTRHELARWGIAHAVYDAMDPASLEAGKLYDEWQALLAPFTAVATPEMMAGAAKLYNRMPEWQGDQKPPFPMEVWQFVQSVGAQRVGTGSGPDQS